MKRILSIILALALMLSVFSVAVFAEDADLADEGAIISGTTGNVSFSVENKGGSSGYKLSVTGDNSVYAQTGSYHIDNFSYQGDAPWMSYNTDINQINITGTKYLRQAFYSCNKNFTGRRSSLSDTGLTVTFDANIVEINTLAFTNAHITKLDLGGTYNTSKLNAIGSYAFMNNDFKEVDIFAADIGSSAFKDCKALTTVHLYPDMQIGENAFAGCTNLRTVIFHGSPDNYDAMMLNVAAGNDYLKNAVVHCTKKNTRIITSPVYLYITAPIEGETPNYSGTMTQNNYCDMEIWSSGWNQDISIFNKTIGQPANDYPYNSDNEYRFAFLLNGKETEDTIYQFSADTPVYINGSRATVTDEYFTAGLPRQNAIAQIYLKPAKLVDSVNLTITAPKANAKPNYLATKDNTDCNFYIGLGAFCPNGTGLEFIDHSKGAPSNVFSDVNNYLGKDETFKAGQKYTARVFLTSATDNNPNQYFSKNFSAKINGSAATIGSDLSDGKQKITWVDYTFTAGSSAGGCLMGDVTGDGKVDNTDAVTLKRYVMGWVGYASKIKVMAAADLDGSGSVNNTDAVILKRCVMDWSGYKAKYIVWK